MQQLTTKITHWVIGLIIGFFPTLLSAQQINIDTLNLTVPKAEEIFLQKNLSLLANQYNVDISKALVQQAKIWDNPVLNTDQTLYDGKFFRHTTIDGQPYGQVYIQVQQLIRTAGKIKKQTQLAQDNVLSAQAQFNDVMRNLKFVLTTDLNNLSQLQNTSAVYKSEMQTMQTLVKGMDEMYKVGDISEKENIRVKALLFSLQSDFNDNLRQQYDVQKEISTLLQLKDNVWVVSDSMQSYSASQVNDLSFAALKDSALQQRPDMAFVKTQSLFQQHNIVYQKALAKPDVNVGVEYDRLNSYVPNYYGLYISLPLPLFNSNKGNIAAARFAFRQSSVVVQQVQNQVDKDVNTAYQKLLATTAMLSNENIVLQNDYNRIMQNMLDSYKHREVSLIEFIDFFDTYKDIRTKQMQQVTNQRNAAAELNLATNQNIIKL